MLKLQNHNHFLLPITKNPLEYGKLIYKTSDLFIMQINKTNIAVINKYEQFNIIKIFKSGELMFEYKDFIDNNTIIRRINNKQFNFENGILIKISRIIVAILFLILFFDNSENLNMTTLLTSIIGLGSKTLIPGDHKRLYSSKKYFKSNWNSVYFDIQNQILTNNLIEAYFNKFWIIVSPKIEEDAHIYFLLKVQFEDNNIHTIGKLFRIDKNNYKSFINQLVNYLEGIGDYYIQSPIKKIVFNYGFKRGAITKELNKSEINLMNFKDMKYPISLNPNDYGKIMNESFLSDHTLYTIIDKSQRLIIFKEYKTENQIAYSKNGLSILEFKDIKYSENKFVRKLGNKSLFFENGSKSLESLELVTPFITKLKMDKNQIDNIITLDIETYGENELTPYLISFYDGSKSFSFYLNDYDSIDKMMRACFDNLFIRKYNNYSIYVHNLAKFDIIFLMKYLVKYVIVDPIIHRGRIIQLNVSYGPNLKYKMRFKDSYLILLGSLEKLCKSFSVKTPKSIFPHKFVNENNLNYLGNVPSINNFFKIDENEYNNYLNKFDNNWNLKNEAIKYCEIDCISLYQILFKFNSLVFELFTKNIHNYPTLPSLAFAIFRSSFMNEENIPKLQGNIANDIREGYTGGSTDMFIPYGENILCYDVNSLYPSQMFDKDMPIGKITKFEGDITKINVNPFGFFYVKVECPIDIMHPILQIRHKTASGIKTISPVGTWNMWIFSEEMYNAENYGYKFEIIKGYTFERKVTFKNYVEFLYNLRVQYNKSNPLNLIAKILLNSLYGKFGMNEIDIKYEIILKENFKGLNESNIVDLIELDKYILIGIKSEKIEEDQNISIGIASAITSYSRIHMSQFKNNPKIKLYYTDTDSAFISADSEIDPSFINEKILGKFKLENKCKKAIFLAPKMYCLLLENGQEIIKVKGLKDTTLLQMKDFEDLLIKDSFKILKHNKWFRDLGNGKIIIKEQLYTLIATDNKRKIIYENNKITSTEPIILN